jgi:hypothetical protein
LVIAAAAGLLGAPWLGLLVAPPELGYAFVSGGYLLAAAAAWTLRVTIKDLPGPAKAALSTSSALALIAALFLSVAAGQLYVIAASMLASIMVFYVALYENRLNLIYAGNGLIYVALTQVVSSGGYASWMYGLV